MKIAILAGVHAPFDGLVGTNYGGLELIVETVAEELAKAGHQIDLLCRAGSQSWHKNINIHTVNYRGDLRAFEPHERILAESNLKILQDADVIWSNTHFGHEFKLKMDGLFDTPVCMTWHHHPNNLQSLPPVDTDNFIFVSNWQRKVCENKFGRKFKTIYNCISPKYHTETDNPVQKHPYYLFLARFSSIKGPHLIVELARKYPNEYFVCAGDVLFTGEPYYVFDLLKQSSKMPNIHFEFNVNLQRRNQLLAGSTGLLHPALWEEPFGLNILDAWSYGKPVLAFDRGASSELIKKYNGYLVSRATSDMTAYSDAFSKFRTIEYDPDKIKNINSVFTPKVCVSRYLNYFKGLIK